MHVAEMTRSRTVTLGLSTVTATVWEKEAASTEDRTLSFKLGGTLLDNSLEPRAPLSHVFPAPF